MKKYILLLCFLVTFQALSQVKGISYQAVISYTQQLPGRDDMTPAFAEKEVCFKFLFTDAFGNQEYEEVISTRTDAFGLVNLVIGTGERIGGSSSSFDGIKWSTDSKFLAVSLDKDGLCANFLPFSNQEFTAVPFALFAINAGNHTVGPQGIQGETGLQGLTGASGNTGSQGVAGANGVTGEKGIQGVQGEQGNAGVQGIAGTKGDTGEVGSQGDKGLRGDTGLQGISGMKGDAGAEGSQGIQGALGNPGVKGIAGSIGEAGVQGVAGTKGDAGSVGTQGIQGDSGVQGIAGIKGEAGVQGIAGIKGDAGNVGTQGIQGDAGVQGIAGTKGDAGNVGTQGIQGFQGDAGVQGIAGAKGDAGVQGVSGTKGDVGDTGTQGLQGDAGGMGIQGVRGLQGETGIQGLTGESGIAASSASFVDLSTNQSVAGNKTFLNTVAATISGNAATVTTNANLTGAITSLGNNTSIVAGAVTNAKLDKANISLSGFGVAEADIALGANKLTELAEPTSAQDAATKNYVDRTRLISSSTIGDIATTTSSQNSLVPGMALTPPLGTYLVLFNGSMLSEYHFSTTQGDLDVARLYTDLMAAPGGIAHPAVFGSEILLPGVYNVTGATSISGTLTLDGQGNPNSLFIIRSPGAITTAANSVLLLTNQAKAENIFWVSEGAISTTAPTLMKGNFVANQGAIALGATTTMEGRLFAVSGALTIGASSSLTKPTGTSVINLGILSSFAMYTSSGAISDCASCTVTGDVGTGLGAITGFTTIDGTIYPAGTVPNDANSTTYAIYQNGVMVPHSERVIKGLDTVVSLQALVSLSLDNTPIEVRWKVASGSSKIGARNLSLIPSGN